MMKCDNCGKQIPKGKGDFLYTDTEELIFCSDECSMEYMNRYEPIEHEDGILG